MALLILKSKFFKSQGFKNSVWSFFSAGSYPVLVLIATPLFLTKLGDRQYGVWVLINTILQLMSSVNFGLGDSSIKFISESQASQDNLRTNQVVSLMLTLSLLVASTLSIFSISVLYLLDGYALIKIGESNPQYLLFCLRAACFLFGLKFLEVSLLSVYQGFKRYDLAAKWSVGSRLFILVANVICALLGYGLEGMLLYALGIQFVYLLLLIFFIKSRYTFLSLHLDFSLRGSRTFLSFGLWSWMQNMLAIFTTQLDKLIVVSTAGLQTLAYYSLGSMIAMQFHSIFVSASNWVFPAVSERVAKKESLFDFYGNAQALLLFFGWGSLILFLVLEKYILTIWLGINVYERASEFIRVFVYYNFFLILMIMPYFFLNGSNNLKQNTLSEFILKFLNIGFAIIFYSLMGTIGLVWGLVISTALVVPYKIMQVNKYVLFKNTAFFNIETIFCGVFLVVVFQISNAYVKIIFFLAFLFVFYFLFLRKTSLLVILKNRIYKS